MNKLVFKSKDNKMIFHPGYLIKNIMDEEGKDTKSMVQLLGLTEKEITKSYKCWNKYNRWYDR